MLGKESSGYQGKPNGADGGRIPETTEQSPNLCYKLDENSCLHSVQTGV